MSYLDTLLRSEQRAREQQRNAARKLKARTRDVFNVADFDAALFEHDESDIAALHDAAMFRSQRESY